ERGGRKGGGQEGGVGADALLRRDPALLKTPRGPLEKGATSRRPQAEAVATRWTEARAKPAPGMERQDREAGRCALREAKCGANEQWARRRGYFRTKITPTAPPPPPRMAARAGRLATARRGAQGSPPGM